MSIANKNSKLFTSNLGPKSVKEQLERNLSCSPGYTSSVERPTSSCRSNRNNVSNSVTDYRRSTSEYRQSTARDSVSGYVSGASSVSNNPRMAKFNELRAKFATISSRVMATEIRHRTVGAGGSGYLDGGGTESSTLGTTLGANYINTNVYSPSPPVSARAVPSIPSQFDIPQDRSASYAPLLTSAEIKMRFERFAHSLAAESKKSASPSPTREHDESAHALATSSVFIPYQSDEGNSTSVSAEAARAVSAVGGIPSKTAVMKSRMSKMADRFGH